MPLKTLNKLPNESSEELRKELQTAKNKYNYCEKLTAQLDKLSDDRKPVTQEDLFRIVLWKLNRHPDVPPDVLRAMDELRAAPNEARGKALLIDLLGCGGFDLPMASTVLRFLAPEHFQIIDQRVYRLMMPEKDRLSLASKNMEKKATLYFDYLNRLRNLAETHGVSFHEADRVFYEYDKAVNNHVPLHKAQAHD